MGIFDTFRKKVHSAGVVYIYEDPAGKKHPMHYYSAVCSCGWTADVVEVDYPDASAQHRVTAQALDHDPAADTEVAFLIERPPAA